jgi:hypothetical protein
MTRDAATLAAVTDVLVPASGSANDLRDAELVTVAAITALAATTTAEAVSRIADRAGAAPATLDADIEEWFRAFRTVQAFQAWRNHGAWITAHPGALGADVAGRFAAAARITDDEAAAAGVVVDGARDDFRSWLGDRVLLLPTVADRAPRLDADAATMDAHRAATLRLTSLASIAGLPAVAAPIGPPTPGGAAISVCFIGAAGTDRSLVHLAARQHG